MPWEQILTAPVPRYRDNMSFLMYVVSDPSESAHVLVPCSPFSGCHSFIAVFDVSYDSHDRSKEPPWTRDAILAVAGKIKSSNKPLAQAPSFYKVLEEAHGIIAHFSLFCLIIPKKIVLYNFPGEYDSGRGRSC